jgi:hypothetical protein
MSFTSNHFLFKFLLLTLLSLSLFTLIASEARSYVKVHKSESAVLRDLNKDFIIVGVQNLVNNLTYASLYNYTSKDFPGIFVDLKNISAAGNSFSINNAYVVNTNSSSIATDTTNSTFVYFSGEFDVRNGNLDNSTKGNLIVLITSSEVIYIKEFSKSESRFKFVGKIRLMWKDPEFLFDAGLPAPLQALISQAFKELFNSKINEKIETELNSELAKWFSTLNYDTQLEFNVSQSFSSKRIPENSLFLNLLGIEAIVLTTKFDTLLTQRYNGYLSGFSERTDLPAESSFDVKTLDLTKLYNAVFIDKFIFESLLTQEAFKGFFMRRSLNAENIPKALNFDLNMRSIAKVLPEISNLYSLMQNVEINYAFFNSKFDFADAKTPKIIANMDFTLFAVNSENQLNQVFNCQTDLAFEITNPLSKTSHLNFNIELIDVGNLKTSNDFSYVNVDYLKFLIREFVNYSIVQKNVKVFEKDLNLSDLFEENFEMKFFKGGVLLYNYLN